MRRTVLASATVAVATVAALGLAAPATAASGAPPGGGWFRVDETAFDVAAGVECDFAIHADPIVNAVFGKTTRTFPDGTPAQQLFTGPLVFRVTNTENGRSYDADASGSALVDYFADGSQTWSVIGPVLIESREGHTNLGRGLFVVNGIYRLSIANHHVTVTLVVGTETNVCDRIA